MASSHVLGRTDVARCWAGFASLGAGLIHLAVTKEHAEEWWLFGVFFLGLGAAQMLWAVVVLARDDVPLRRVVAGANVAVALLWLVTRTIGIPIGPEPWQPEATGRADVLCTLLELALVAVLLVLPWLAAGERRSPVRAGAGRFVALMFAGAVAVAAVTTPALADTPASGRAHGHMP